MKIKAVHDIYGPVVRIAPNELSFISPGAWDDIYSGKPIALERGAIFYGVIGQNTFLSAGHEAHARMRKVISPAFRSSAVRSCEELPGDYEAYVHLLVERLGVSDKNKACAEKSDAVGRHETIVDIVRWLNFFCFVWPETSSVAGIPSAASDAVSFTHGLDLSVAGLSRGHSFLSPVLRALGTCADVPDATQLEDAKGGV